MQRGVAKKLPPLDWDDVRVLLAVLRARSLLGGARLLGVDKSTASRRLDALEAALGARLFLRTREGLRASPLAERLRVHAEAMEAEARALASLSVASGEEVAGLVRLATTEALAVRLVQGGLLDLRTTYPGLAIELLGGNRPVDLERGEAELALRVAAPGASSLKARVIARLGFALYAAPAYLRARGVPRTPEQLAGHDLLVPSGELGALPEARWLSSCKGPRVALRSSSLPALVAAAVLGHGIGCFTRPWGDNEPGLDRVMLLEDIPPRPVWLVVHPDVARTPAVKVVADRVAQLIREAAG